MDQLVLIASLREDSMTSTIRGNQATASSTQPHAGHKKERHASGNNQNRLMATMPQHTDRCARVRAAAADNPFRSFNAAASLKANRW